MRILYVLVQVCSLVVVARLVLGWFTPPIAGPVASVHRGIVAATEPVLVPVRQIVRPVQIGASALDLSPVVVLLLLQLLGGLFAR
jgi:uncharacterized protein YggT (Ycf19 family)